ncbi:hypothetical protein EDD15DRAFT_2380746 [Pisolithus albus]|nr:hypothetical protein EDD15DRAFT_2380746 [Pisolithus albus]
MDGQARRSHKKTDRTMVEAPPNDGATVLPSSREVAWIGRAFRRSQSAISMDQWRIPLRLFWNATSMLSTPISWLSFVVRQLVLALPMEEKERVRQSVCQRSLFQEKLIQDMIVFTRQPVKPMRAPSTRWKSSNHRVPHDNTAAGTTPTITEEECEDEDVAAPQNTGTPYIAGEFCAALDTLFDTL